MLQGQTENRTNPLQCSFSEPICPGALPAAPSELQTGTAVALYPGHRLGPCFGRNLDNTFDLVPSSSAKVWMEEEAIFTDGRYKTMVKLIIAPSGGAAVVDVLFSQRMNATIVEVSKVIGFWYFIQTLFFLPDARLLPTPVEFKTSEHNAVLV